MAAVGGLAMRVIVSSSARTRLRTARAFLDRFQPDTELLIVAATRGAADDFARDVARGRATFGLHRFSLTELAAQAAAIELAAAGRVPGTFANAEAMAARAAFDAVAEDQLGYFAPVASTPGFPRALARTVHELRLAGAGADAVGGAGAGSADVACLLDRIDDQLRSAGIEDRASLFQIAASAWQRGVRWRGWPVLMLDVPFGSAVEGGFALAVCQAASDALVTIAEGDESSREGFGATVPVEILADEVSEMTDLGRLRRHIFTLDPPPERTKAGDVRLFSAPGEAREALEIARRVLDEAAAGARFDEMAVCLRSPQQYTGLLEHAFDRAAVPAYFDRGTQRPDPSGRAFVAILSCACEKLSAKRFDEY